MDINTLSIRTVIPAAKRKMLLEKTKVYHMAYCVYSSTDYEEIKAKFRQMKAPFTYICDNINGVHILLIIAGVQHYLSLGLEEEWKPLTREVLI